MPYMAAVVHQIGLLETRLTGDDVGVAHYHGAVRRDHLLRQWGCLLICGARGDHHACPAERGDNEENPDQHPAGAIFRAAIAR
jgi:hypothetical protein